VDQLADQFGAAWLQAGGRLYRAINLEDALGQVLSIVRSQPMGQVLVSEAPVIQELDLAARFHAEGLQTIVGSSAESGGFQEEIFAASVGVTGVDYLIAETGTIALFASEAEPRANSLVPPVHIAIAYADQTLADLADLFNDTRGTRSTGLREDISIGAPYTSPEREDRDTAASQNPGLAPVAYVGVSQTNIQREDGEETPARRQLPSVISMITGPSKTGDIELRLVTGVHGPGIVHVVLVRNR
jgi:L-lactate utilization protein LutC